jgi:uncharacterized membrane protein YqjE
MTRADTPKSTGEMMSDIMGNVGNLVRKEVDLARIEVADSLKNATAALSMIAVALVVAIAGINLLATSLVALVIRAGVSPVWATSLVGAGLVLVAVVVFVSAKSTLNNIGFLPARTARSVRRDAAAVKDAYNDK